MSEFIPLGYLPLERAIARAQAVWFAAEEKAYGLTAEEAAILYAHNAAVVAVQAHRASPRLNEIMDGATMDQAVETPLIASLKDRMQCQAAIRPVTWRHLRALLFGEHLRAYGLLEGVGWKPIAHGQWIGKQAETPPAKVKVFIGAMPFEAHPFVKEDELETVLLTGPRPSEQPPSIMAAFRVSLSPSMSTQVVDAFGAPLSVNALLGREAPNSVVGVGVPVAHMRFWSNPKGRQEWPADRPNHIFLARAFHALGQARFGADWAGTEPYGPAPANLVASIQSPDALKAMREENKKQSQAAAQRAQPVRLEIVKECEAGRLLAAWEPPAGGDLVPIPREHWSRPSVAISRFFWCQMHFHIPYGLAVGGRGFGYIFIERSGLERLTGASLPAPPAAAPVPASTANEALKKKPAGGKRGPKTIYDWPKIRAEAFRLLEYHGGVSAHDPDLPSQEALVQLLLQFCQDTWEKQPGSSLMRKHVSGWLAECDAGARK